METKHINQVGNWQIVYWNMSTERCLNSSVMNAILTWRELSNSYVISDVWYIIIFFSNQHYFHSYIYIPLSLYTLCSLTLIRAMLLTGQMQQLSQQLLKENIYIFIYIYILHENHISKYWKWNRTRLETITTKVLSSNAARGEVYSIQHYVLKFFSDLRQVGGFLRVLQFPRPIKLTAII